jgi:hypothetical protein
MGLAVRASALARGGFLLRSLRSLSPAIGGIPHLKFEMWGTRLRSFHGVFLEEARLISFILLGFPSILFVLNEVDDLVHLS